MRKQCMRRCVRAVGFRPMANLVAPTHECGALSVPRFREASILGTGGRLDR
jgi:hypothetical protein